MKHIYIIRLSGGFLRRKDFMMPETFGLGNSLFCCLSETQAPLNSSQSIPACQDISQQQSLPVPRHIQGFGAVSHKVIFGTNKTAQSSQHSVLCESGEERAWPCQIQDAPTSSSNTAIQGPRNEVKLSDLYSGTLEGNPSLMDMEKHSQLHFHLARLS